MMRYTSLKRRPKHFQSFTGITVEEFDRLVAYLKDSWVQIKLARLKKKNPNRKRKIGGGRKYALENLEDQLLLTLVWIKLYPSYLLLEYIFNVDESTVCRTIQLVSPLLAKRFILPNPKKRKQIRSLEELREIIPNLDDILTDATEQAIPRPQKKTKRNKHHSGKKKKFTVKTQIAVNRQGRILHVSQTIGGRTHDYKLFHQSGLPQRIPKDSTLYLDSGYQGIKKDYPSLHTSIPFKRSRSHKELTRSEKIYNKKQRRIRIKAENVIADLKKYQVLAQVYRHSLQNYNTIFRAVANVVDFRMMLRQA